MSPCERCFTDTVAPVSAFATDAVRYRRLRHVRRTKKSQNVAAPETKCFVTRQCREIAVRISIIC